MTDYKTDLSEERDFYEVCLGEWNYRYLIPRGVDTKKALREDFIVFKLDTQTIRIYNPTKTAYVERSWLLEWLDEKADYHGSFLKREKPNLAEDICEIEDQQKDEECREISRAWKLATSEESNPKMALCSDICCRKEKGFFVYQAEKKWASDEERKEDLKKTYPLWYAFFYGTEEDREKILRADGW